MTLADLAEHATEEVTPISVDVGDLRVYECPPNGQVRNGRALIYFASSDARPPASLAVVLFHRESQR